MIPKDIDMQILETLDYIVLYSKSDLVDARIVTSVLCLTRAFTPTVVS